MSNELLGVILLIGGFLVARSLTGPFGLIASGVIAWLSRRLKPATPANPSPGPSPSPDGTPNTPLLDLLGGGPLAQRVRDLLRRGLSPKAAEEEALFGVLDGMRHSRDYEILDRKRLPGSRAAQLDPEPVAAAAVAVEPPGSKLSTLLGEGPLSTMLKGLIAGGMPTDRAEQIVRSHLFDLTTVDPAEPAAKKDNPPPAK